MSIDYHHYGFFGIIHKDNKKEIVNVQGCSWARSIRPVWNAINKMAQENKWECIALELTCTCVGKYKEEEKSGGHKEAEECEICYNTQLDPIPLSAFDESIYTNPKYTLRKWFKLPFYR